MGHGALLGKVDFSSRIEVPVLIVAGNDKQVLQWTSHRSDYICEEEVAEPDFAKGRDNDVPKSL